MSATTRSAAVLYIGIGNILQVKERNNIADYQLEVRGTSSEIQKIEPGTYLVRVHKMDSCTIIVSSKEKQVFSRKYVTAIIPEPIAIVAATRDTIVSKGKLLLNPFLSILLPNCDYEFNSRILSFEAAFVASGDSIFTANRHNIFSAEQVKLIQQLRKGDRIWFSRIIASCASGRNQMLRPLEITIE